MFFAATRKWAQITASREWPLLILINFAFYETLCKVLLHEKQKDNPETSILLDGFFGSGSNPTGKTSVRGYQEYFDIQLQPTRMQKCFIQRSIIQPIIYASGCVVVMERMQIHQLFQHWCCRIRFATAAELQNRLANCRLPGADN